MCPGSEREVGELAGEGGDVPDDQLAVTRHRGDGGHAALRTLVDPQLRYLNLKKKLPYHFRLSTLHLVS